MFFYEQSGTLMDLVGVTVVTRSVNLQWLLLDVKKKKRKEISAVRFNIGVSVCVCGGGGVGGWIRYVFRFTAQMQTCVLKFLHAATPFQQTSAAGFEGSVWTIGPNDAKRAFLLQSAPV